MSNVIKVYKDNIYIIEFNSEMRQMGEKLDDEYSSLQKKEGNLKNTINDPELYELCGVQQRMTEIEKLLCG